MAHPIWKRFEKAKARRERYNALLADCYAYALPQFDPSGNLPEGDKVDRMVYDSQAVRSLAKRTARMHGQLFPPGQPFIGFDFGTFDLDELSDDDRVRAQTILTRAEKAVHAAIDVSNFHMEIDSALSDVLISTGCLVFNEGTVEEPFRFEHVPIHQIVPEEGPTGGIDPPAPGRSAAYPRAVAGCRYPAHGTAERAGRSGDGVGSPDPRSGAGGLSL